MYRFKEQKHTQEKLFQRFFSFDHDIDKTNRWVVLAEKIPWVEIEEKYCYLFMQGGKPAFSIRVALGALIIKEKLNITDEETVAQITENPYLQYFMRYDQYSTRRPFDSGSMTHFRKRFNAEIMAEINEMLFLTTQEPEKSGGARTIYYFMSERNTVYLLWVYAKKDTEELPQVIKHLIGATVRNIKRS